MFSKIRDAGDERSGSRRGNKSRNQRDRKSSGRLLCAKRALSSVDAEKASSQKAVRLRECRAESV